MGSQTSNEQFVACVEECALWDEKVSGILRTGLSDDSLIKTACYLSARAWMKRSPTNICPKSFLQLHIMDGDKELAERI